MSKGNLFLGFGRGKVGDVVFSRLNGEQVTRARNRKPKNPQTPLQLLQRSIMKTVSTAYSAFIQIADHSFQGFETGTPNQSRFVQRNVEMFRERLAELINTADPEEIVTSQEANFNAASVMVPLINDYFISEGHLPSIGLQFGQIGESSDYGFHFPLAGTLAATPTYADIVRGLGLQQGDQLTFCALVHNDSSGFADTAAITSFQFARVILEPGEGDMTTPFFAAGEINAPNARNEGSVRLSYANNIITVNGVNGVNNWRGQTSSIVGMAIIVSRQSGNVWMRSTEKFTLIPSGPVDNHGSEWDYLTQLLGDAVLSFMKGTSSTLYLNQAESGF